MNNAEARALLSEKLAEYRELPYEHLASRIDEQDHFEIRAVSGAEYQIKIQFFWDGRPDKDVRVVGAVDDGGWRAYMPLTDSFILAPDGSFVGEDAT